jgi:osomolarity two-component system, response regulator SKN7
MVRILRKHLRYMLQNPPPPGVDDMAQNGQPQTIVPSSQSYGSQSAMNLAHMVGPMTTAGGVSAPIKFENTPIQSPATSSSWHSPNQIGTSPNLDGTGYLSVPPSAVSSVAAGMVLVPPGPGSQRSQYVAQAGLPPISTPTIGRMADELTDDRPDKRPRLFGPGSGQGTTYV